MKRKTDIISTIFLIFLLLVGLSVMLYPSFSDWWNKNKASHIITDHKESVAQLDKETYERILSEARNYNKELTFVQNPLDNHDEPAGYFDMLDVTGSGIMGFISIPAIRVELPIYHGTDDEVLNSAVGHLQGSSLPVGGLSTHCVLSGHRGLPSAKLFTDLDKIVVGDTFTLNVLNEVLTYEVEQINIVKPDQVSTLSIRPNEDHTTLVTCTPYGVNTHRLLIYAHRIDTALERQQPKAFADAVQVDPLLVVPIIAVPLLILLFIFWALSGKAKKSYIKVRYLYR